jgi:hypothetical protein
MGYGVENAVFQWEEGYRTLQAARPNPAAYRTLARAVVAVQDELRKRLGSSFSIPELAALYRESGDWTQLTIASDSDQAPPLDTAAAVDAAFYLYMREASDFGGGSPRAS